MYTANFQFLFLFTQDDIKNITFVITLGWIILIFLLLKKNRSVEDFE
jgi:hypothetical protein